MHRFLIISFFLVLISCASYPKKQGFVISKIRQENVVNPYFSDHAIDYVYKASISVFDTNFGGILIIKKIEKDHHRVVFTTEMGNTLFDFSFQGDNFKVNRIVKKLNKKLLINILKKDFNSLIHENNTIVNTYNCDETTIFETQLKNQKGYFYFNQKQLTKLVRAKNKEKVIINFFEVEDQIAKKIEIIHKNSDLTIFLKFIND